MRTNVEYPSSKGTRDFLKKHCDQSLSYCFVNLSDSLEIVPVSREHLTRELNGIIRNYGRTVNKILLSHSCRVSFITRVCKEAGIEAAKIMVEHAHISTTNVYNRNYWNNRARQRIMNDSLLDFKEEMNTDLENQLSKVLDKIYKF